MAKQIGPVPSARSGTDTHEHTGPGFQALAEIASHPERDEDPVLAVVGCEDGLLQIAPVLHQLRASLEGGTVLAAHVDGDAPVLRDATRLEALALGGEIDGVLVLVEPAPGGHGAGLARLTI